MNWLITLVVVFLSGCLGLFCGGFLGDVCVKWYRISSLEGGSGYFVVFLALLGGVFGLVVGAVAAIVVLKSAHPSFLSALLASWGAMIVLFALALALARGFADLPPQIEGQQLILEVEVRLPKGDPAPADGEGERQLSLHSMRGSSVRKSETGALRPQEARMEEGRWIVPGDVFLFTGRGRRSLVFQLNHGGVTGFQIPLPARPGRNHMEWSEWMPRAPWPETNVSYRFRVQFILPPPEPPMDEEVVKDPLEEARAEVMALDLDASIDEWLPFLGYAGEAETRALAIERLRSRSGFRDELSELLVADDAPRAAVFLRLVEHVTPDAGLIEDISAAGYDIAERIREVNAKTQEEDPSYEGAADVSTRFSAWMTAVRYLRESSAGDFTRELQLILELSRVRADSRAMQQDVCRIASFYLQEWAGIPPLPSDPKPR